MAGKHFLRLPRLHHLLPQHQPHFADVELRQDHINDGLSLLTSYVLNLDPHDPLPGRPVPVLDPTTMSMSLYAALKGVAYWEETNLDLRNWSTGDVTTPELSPESTHTATIPRDTHQRFLRLVVD